jgi:hypothetical protein
VTSRAVPGATKHPRRRTARTANTIGGTVDDALEDEPQKSKPAPQRRATTKDRLRIVAAGGLTLAAVGSLVAALGGGSDARTASNPDSIERAVDPNGSAEVTTDKPSTTITRGASDSGKGAAAATSSGGRSTDGKGTATPRSTRARLDQPAAKRSAATVRAAEAKHPATKRPRHTTTTTRRRGTTTTTRKPSPPPTDPPATTPPGTEPPTTTPTTIDTTPPPTDPPTTSPPTTVDTNPPPTDPPRPTPDGG